MSRPLMLSLLFILCAGCAGEVRSSGLPATVPASGVLRLDGKPLSSAVVTFVPAGETKGIESTGITDDQGRFALTQVRGGNGASPGQYRVVVSRYLKPDGTPVASDESPADVGAVESLPAKYSHPDRSSLLVTVGATGGEFPLELKGR